MKNVPPYHGVVDSVDGQEVRHNLCFSRKSFGKEGAQRPIDEAWSQDLLVGGSQLTPQKVGGDPSGRCGFLPENIADLS